MNNKTIEEIRIIKTQFLNQYREAFRAVGNNLAVGIGGDEKTGEYHIAVNLTNDKLMDTLPKEYDGVQVDVEVVGEIFAQ